VWLKLFEQSNQCLQIAVFVVHHEVLLDWLVDLPRVQIHATDLKQQHYAVTGHDAHCKWVLKRPRIQTQNGAGGELDPQQQEHSDLGLRRLLGLDRHFTQDVLPTRPLLYQLGDLIEPIQVRYFHWSVLIHIFDKCVSAFADQPPCDSGLPLHSR